MEDKQLSELLKNEAVASGLCEQWTNEWSDEETQQTLINKFKKGLDFCLERNWPSAEFIKDNFNEALLAKNLIFVDGELDIHNGSNGVWILNGSTKGKLHFGGYACVTLEVRHNCELQITAETNALVFVHVYDQAKVTVISNGAHKVNVIAYGEDAEVVSTGEVNVRRKTDKI